jgi:hypothetical protein
MCEAGMRAKKTGSILLLFGRGFKAKTTRQNNRVFAENTCGLTPVTVKSNHKKKTLRQNGHL